MQTQTTGIQSGYCKNRQDMKTFNSSKKAKMQGILGIVILVITITALGLYTGSQPGRTPMINWQTQESIERYVTSRSSGFEMTGNAAAIAGNAAANAGKSVGMTENAAGGPVDTIGTAGLAEDAPTTEDAVRMEDGMTGAVVTGMAGVGGMIKVRGAEL